MSFEQSPQYISPERQYLAEAAFDRSAVQLMQYVPEFAENKDQITQGSVMLIEEFAVKPELFDDQSHTLFFGALGHRYAQLESSKHTLTVSQYVAEKEFIGVATAMLAGKDSELYEHMRPFLTRSEQVDESELEAIYDRYVDAEMSAELRGAIDGDLLSATKEHMQIGDQDEEHFEIRVLRIGRGNVLDGLYPGPPASSEADDPTAWATYRRELQAFNAYAAELATNTDAFGDETGSNAPVPPAWICQFNGVTSLNIPSPIARKILHPETKPTYSYDFTKVDQDTSVVGHEYAHTQGGYNLKGQIYYGISFEERRAEFFSGDAAGYPEAKGLALDLTILGFNIYRFMKERPKGGDASELYTAMANHFGMQNTLKLALLAPPSYLASGAEFQQSANNHIGPHDVIVQEIYNTLMQNAEKAKQVHENIGIMAKGVAEDQDIEMWSYFRKDLNQSHFITDLVLDRITKQQ